ncbi:DegT/DnrJ/EryC1/StrS family aminotransferase [Gimesia sp.]|uniref:DegT/DnrJ/EryC1/StrS family aminotransferase n=1 Tax=Gimesia sp. TaxID=2024833 RepID=UPI000C4AB418|nr:DegT/DnrJ/EryC1/StrS family aminotransferase [Gimesia sp.]MAX36313.1 erythromycin biosynthesis sensory transduction protein eryC1 [Gimesia sp.]|tara:strand:- start:14474 stop:15598 length:1125 start_codon:yes stop_codon:yes gene_type:complete
MKILFNQPKRENDAFAQEINLAIEQVIESGIYILGSNVTAFEQEFAQYCQTRHCCAVGNGTDALEIALRALGVGPGDEVITVANAGGYSTTACNLVGAVPVYVDVEPDHLLLDYRSVPAAVSPRTRCVIATHLYGQAVNVRELRATLDAAGYQNIKILEDCAQAHGAMVGGEIVGSLADIATFSFYPTKNLSALGDGGAITTSHDELAERCRCLRQYGWTSKYRSDVPDGRNSRLDELQAAILRVKLRHLNAFNEKRRAICNHLNQTCQGIVDVVTTPAEGNVSHLFVARHPLRDQICQELIENGVATDIHYPVLDLNQNSLSARSFRAVDLPHSQQATQEIFSLPCYTGITDEELDYIRQIFESKIAVIVKGH